MSWICFIIAVMIVVVGHVFKAKRWKLFISVYEDCSLKTLLKSLSIGHFINALVPFRIGDLVRIHLTGKKMKNGYPFSFATVIADLYVDTITVGIIMFILFISGQNGIRLNSIITLYVLAFIILVAISLIAIYKRKETKKVIATISSVFNEKIELAILYSSYLFINSLKAIFSRIDKKKFVLYTLLMWSSYLTSYIVLAMVFNREGINTTTSEVFATLFTPSTIYTVEKSSYIYWLLFLVLPLVICLTMVSFYKKETTTNNRFALPQLESFDRLAFLKAYYSEENPEHLYDYLKINENIQIIKDSSAGSNASTLLIMKNNNIYYRKYAFENDGKKLKEQIDWIRDHQRLLPLPAISYEDFRDSYCVYDMPCSNNTIGMFQYIHSFPIENSWGILKQVLDDLNRNIYASSKKADLKIINKYIEEKVINNIARIENNRYINALEKFNTIMINGKEFPTLHKYSDLLDREHLLKVFNKDQCCDIHGDLTIENIICYTDKRKNQYYLIDPNTGNVLNSPFVDYGKLLQSLHGGYEFLMMVNNVEIDGNNVSYLKTNSLGYSELYNKVKEYMNDHFTKKEIISIYYHEIVNWLRLLPYKLQKNEKLAVIYYSELLEILKDVKEIENEK